MNEPHAQTCVLSSHTSKEGVFFVFFPVQKLSNIDPYHNIRLKQHVRLLLKSYYIMVCVAHQLYIHKLRKKRCTSSTWNTQEKDRRVFFNSNSEPEELSCKDCE